MNPLFLALTGEAAGGENLNIFGRLTNLMNTFYLDIVIIVTPLCALVAVICSIVLMITDDDKTISRMKAWRVRAIKGWFITMFIGAIVAYVTVNLGFTPSSLIS